MRRFGITVVSTLIAVLVGTMVLGRTTLPAKARNPALDWPAFTMVVKVWRPDLGPNRSPGYARFKIDYNGPTNWRSETIEYPGQEDEVGSWGEYDGKRLRSFDAKFNYHSESPAPPDGHYAPPEILRRTRVAAWKGWVGWQKGTDKFGNTVRKGVHEFRNDQGVKVIEETEIVIDRATSLPLRITDRVHGEVVQEGTVEELTLR